MNPLNFLRKISLSGKKESVLGFDIGSYAIKCAEVTKYKNRILLTGFICVKTIENAIINKIINDVDLLKVNIEKLILNFKSDTTRVNISIPYENTIYGNFTVSSHDIIQKIERKINEEIPYKIEDVYYSYFILPERQSYVVYYIVSRKENIDKLIEIFDYNGLSVANIDVDFVNLHNLTEFLYGPENRLIIDWGHEKIKLHFSNRDIPVYTRELLNLGIKDIITEIQRELEIQSYTAESLLVNPPTDNRLTVIKSILKKYIYEISEEIRLSIEMVRSEYNLSPERFYIIGGGARIPRITEILSKLTGFEIEFLDIRKKLDISKDIDPKYLEIINKQGIIAVATAVREFI